MTRGAYPRKPLGGFVDNHPGTAHDPDIDLLYTHRTDLYRHRGQPRCRAALDDQPKAFVEASG